MTVPEIRATPSQLRALAEWSTDGPEVADIKLSGGPSRLLAEQGPERAVFDVAGNPLDFEGWSSP